MDELLIDLLYFEEDEADDHDAELRAEGERQWVEVTVQLGWHQPDWWWLDPQ